MCLWKTVKTQLKCPQSQHFTMVSALFAKTKPTRMEILIGGQWLSGRVLDSRPRGCGFEPHYDLSFSKTH